MSSALANPFKVGRIVYDAASGEYVAKRSFTCRSYYTFEGLTVKCQLHGRHKGVHLHGLARAGAVITITWHAMVSANKTPTKAAGKKKSVKKVMERLELESYDDAGVGLLVVS